MQHSLTFGKAFGVGFLDTIILTAIMLPLVISGTLGIEQPFAASFARSLFGESTPLPVGIVFHLVYVTFWNILFLMYFIRRPYVNAAILAIFLWILQALIFYPMVGWGFLGTDVSASTALIPLIPHALFFIILGVSGHIINARQKQ